MNSHDILIDRETLDRLLGLIRRFLGSEQGFKAKLMFAGLVALLLGINGMNVVNNYVGRDFMTAIENRNMARFINFALVYVGVFAGATLVSVFAKVMEDRLALLWREYITQLAIERYLEKGTYHYLDASGELENPDQRIAEDVRAFTVTALSFVSVFLNSSMTILAFSGVVWSISPLLFFVAVVYAAFGSYFAIRLGRPLAGLNYAQLDKDANFRSTLIHVRENAEPLLLARRKGRLQQRLLQTFDEVTANVRKVINVNRNLGLFTGGYYWMIGLIPSLIVAPSFINGEIEFGVVTQAGMAFSMLVGSFSLVVTQFQSISSFTAVLARLEGLYEAVEEAREARPTIAIREEGGRLLYQNVSLFANGVGECLLKDFSATIPQGTRVLIAGANEAAGVALLKATARVWGRGEGTIIRPGADELLFLAENPYLPPGTLREILLPVAQETVISDSDLEKLLGELGLDELIERVGGLGEEQDWGSFLPLAEQQLLAFIHVLLRSPRFVFLDRPGTTLAPSQILKMLNILAQRAITYVSIGQEDQPLALYDVLIEIGEDGSWAWKNLHPQA